jgi:hypothetical protein
MNGHRRRTAAGGTLRAKSGEAVPNILHHVVFIQAIASVVILCGFIIATTMLQQRALNRSNEVLATVQPKLRETALYAIAMDFLNRRRLTPPGLFSPVHAIPIWFLLMIVLFGSLLSFFGAELFPTDTVPSYILGGALAADPQPDLVKLESYQSGTVFLLSMTFLSAYVWTIATLVVRINNFDTSPVTFYFLSVRILTSLLVAVLIRHMIKVLPDLPVIDESMPYGLAVLGFVIGWNPTLWIDEFMLRTADFLKQRIARQRRPDPGDMPQNMTLSMLQGMLDSESARLMELNIDNCQKLACENAILIWLRTPYNLDVIVDWIAQAQLFLLFEPNYLENLRRAGIRDVFAYYTILLNPAARAAAQAVAGVPPDIMEQHSAVLAQDPKFTKLGELRRAIT